MSSAQEKAIAFGCCKLCSIRLTGTKTEVEEACKRCENDSKENSEQCVACLGLLQMPLDDVITKLTEEKERQKYELNNEDVAFELSLPTCTIIRDFAVWLQLQYGPPPGNENYPKFRSVKNMFKTKLTSKVENALQCKIAESDASTGSKKSKNSGEKNMGGQFCVRFSFIYEDNAKECVSIYPDSALKKEKKKGRKRKRKCTEESELVGLLSVTRELRRLGRKNIRDIEGRLVWKAFEKVRKKVTCLITLKRKPLYIYGRYVKLMRGVSQSPWVIDGKRMADTSVSELVSKRIMKYFGVTNEENCNFLSSGREDVDVRMLGSGRPFCLEITDALTSRITDSECKAIQKDTNLKAACDAVYGNSSKYDGAVLVNNLKQCSLQTVEALKSSASSKRKKYAAVCSLVDDGSITQELLNEKLGSLVDVELDQKTPIRVLHRRSQINRKKMIHSMKCEWMNEKWFILELEASAGTYIKEFVHGDLGRTMPNVGSLLGQKCDILQLDVTEVITKDDLLE